MLPPVSWPASEDAVAVDRVAFAGVAQGELDGGVLAGRVVVIRRLARRGVLGRNQDVAPARRLGRPLVDRGLGPWPGMQDDDRRIAPQRMIFRRQPDGVLGGLVVFLLQHAVDARVFPGSVSSSCRGGGMSWMIRVKSSSR